MTTRRPPRFFPQPFDCKRRTHLVAVGAIACIALTACASGSGPFAKHSSPYAPTALKRGEEAVDGLTVGHRLTAAGEHELALKAYLRAASEQGITVDVLSAIGSANLQLGRLGQAERILRKATEMDGSFVPAWNTATPGSALA